MAEIFDVIKKEVSHVKSAFLHSKEFFKTDTDSWEKFNTEYSTRGELYEAESEIYKQFVDRLEPILGNPNLKDAVEKARNSLINELYKPLTCETVQKHGKKILIVRKPVILFSYCLPHVDTQLNLDIEEVHFVASEVIYINANLDKSKWHGKNVVVISKKIKCIIPGIIWDLSGIDGDNARETPALNGTDQNIDGKDGEDGKPGESGGNVVLFTEKFDNAHLLTFNGNGGAGGKGQMGGNGNKGMNGKNGKEMPKEIFESFISPAVKLESSKKLKAILGKIHDLDIEYDTRNFDGIDVGDDASTVEIRRDCYVTGMTKKGHHIEFAFCSSWFGFKHSYILVKGSLGKPGTLGGLKGLGGSGGPGGFPGFLLVYTLTGSEYQSTEIMPSCSSNHGANGEDGNDGNEGMNGKYGKNGKDFGFMDRSSWCKTKNFGPGTFELCKATTEPDNARVWCVKHDNYRCIKVKTSNSPTPLQQTRMKQTKHKVKLEATRKTEILLKECLDSYTKEIRESIDFAKLYPPEFIQIQDQITKLKTN